MFYFRYIDQYCNPNDQKMILFQDDDTVVIENDFEKFVLSQGFIGHGQAFNPDKVIPPFCLKSWNNHNRRVLRPESTGPRSAIELERWAVTREVYSKNFYPPYCSGTCYSISSSYARKIANTASVTNPQMFHHDDVFFSGILRVKADIDIPTTVKGICTHYNNITKIQDIKNIVLKYCIKNNILVSLCLIE